MPSVDMFWRKANGWAAMADNDAGSHLPEAGFAKNLSQPKAIFSGIKQPNFKK